MKLKGTARASELPEIFHMLSSNERHGVLEINRQGAVRKVYFGPQGVKLFYESGRSRNLLGQILIGKGVINEKTLHAALKDQKTSKLPLGEILCDSGAAKQKDVEEALTYQLREELFDLLTWEDAQFEFHEGADEPKEFGRSYLQRPHFNPNASIMEAARRADEWQRIREVIRSEQSVLLRGTDEVALEGELESDELALRVLDLADGARSMGSMLDALRLSEFDVYESAHGLLNAGAVKLASARDLADLAAQALSASEPERARRLLVNAAGLCGDDFELRYDLGTMLLWAGADDDAHKQLDVVLGKLVEDGLEHKVLEMLDHIRDEFPDAPYSYERRMKLLDPAKDFADALPLARELTRIYHARDNGPRAERMLKHLTAFKLTEAEDFVELARFLESNGEQTLAARQFAHAARKLSYKRREAVRLYRKAIKLDPKLNVARKELHELQSSPGRQREMLIRLVGWAAALCLVVFGGKFVWQREVDAETELDFVNTRAQGHLVRRNYDAALADYDTFLAKHPYTAASMRVKKHLADIRIDRDACIASRGYTLERILREAEAAEDRLDFDAANARYRELQTFAVTSDMVRKGKDNIRRLTSEMKSYLACLARSRRYEAAKDYQKALESCLEARRSSERLFDRDGIKLPLYVESDPPGAVVQHRGTVLGKTPLLLRREYHTPVTLEVSHEGYYATPLVVLGSSRRATYRASLVKSHRPTWRFRTEGITDEAPTVSRDICFFSTRKGRVYAANLHTGAKVWEHPLEVMSGSYVSAPLVLGDRVLVATMTGRLHALSRTTGRELWRYKGKGFVSGPPIALASDNQVLLAHVDGTLVWLDATRGTAARTRKLPKGIAGAMLLRDDTMYYGATDRTVCAVDPDSSKTLWRKGVRLPADQTMTSAGNLIFVRFDAGKLLALTRTRGKLVWSCTADDSDITAAATDGARVYVATDSGTLSALEARSGEVAWRVKLDGAVHVRPTAAGGRLYAGTEEGKLWVFDAVDGKLLWKTRLSGALAAPVTTAGKWILVTTTQGTLEAFER